MARGSNELCLVAISTIGVGFLDDLMAGIGGRKNDGGLNGLPHGVIGWLGVALVFAVLVAGLLLWRPGYQAWALLTAGLALALGFFFLEGIVTRVNRIPGHAFQWVLLGLGTILAVHLLADQFLHPETKSGLRGDVTVSMIFHISLVAVGIMLVQSLGSVGRFGDVCLNLSALTLMLGGGVTAAMISPGPGRDSLWVLGFGGMIVWLTPLFRVNSSKTGWDAAPTPFEKKKNYARLVVATAVFALLAVTGGTLGWCVFGLAVALAALLYVVVQKTEKAIWAWFVGGLGVVGVFAFWLMVRAESLPAEIFGRGEKGFAFVYGGSSGASIIAATTGWVGLLVLLAGVIGLAVLGLRSAKRGYPGQLRRAAIWTAATFLLTAAMLLPGGFVSPASVCGMMVAWGFWYRITGAKRAKPRPGWILLVVVVGIMFLTGISDGSGLVMKMGRVYGFGDKPTHLVAGFVLTMVLAWMLSRKYWWLGVIGLILAALAGGAGELAQKMLSTRNVEWADWKAHLWGSAIAAFFFAIGLGGRWAVSKPARSNSWGKVHKYYYLGWSLRILLFASFLWPLTHWGLAVYKLTAHRWREDKPFLLVTDAVLTPLLSRRAYLPGVTNQAAAVRMSSVFTATQGEWTVEQGWGTFKRDYLLIYPRVSRISPGENNLWFAGMPYSELAYEREAKPRVIGLDFGQPLLILDARDIEKWEKSQPDSKPLKDILAKLPANLAVAFVHPGPADEYKQVREVLRKKYPDTPCICDVTFKSGAVRTAYSLSRLLARKDRQSQKLYPLPRINLITSDIKLVKAFQRYLRKVLIVDIVSPEPVKKERGRRLIYSKSVDVPLNRLADEAR